MSENRSEADRGVALILEGIAKSIAETTPEAVLAECQEDGLDVDALATRTKDVLAQAVKRYKQGKLVAARKEYESAVVGMAKKVYPLPQSREKKRELLRKLLLKKPELQGGLTAAARDFRELSDQDIDLALSQLQELGVLDDLRMED